VESVSVLERSRGIGGVRRPRSPRAVIMGSGGWSTSSQYDCCHTTVTGRESPRVSGHLRRCSRLTLEYAATTLTLITPKVIHP
jgi:hypothetical protein